MNSLLVFCLKWRRCEDVNLWTCVENSRGSQKNDREQVTCLEKFLGIIVVGGIEDDNSQMASKRLQQQRELPHRWRELLARFLVPFDHKVSKGPEKKQQKNVIFFGRSSVNKK